MAFMSEYKRALTKLLRIWKHIKHFLICENCKV